MSTDDARLNTPDGAGEQAAPQPAAPTDAVSDEVKTAAVEHSGEFDDSAPAEGGGWQADAERAEEVGD